MSPNSLIILALITSLQQPSILCLLHLPTSTPLYLIQMTIQLVNRESKYNLINFIFKINFPPVCSETGGCGAITVVLRSLPLNIFSIALLILKSHFLVHGSGRLVTLRNTFLVAIQKHIHVHDMEYVVFLFFLFIPSFLMVTKYLPLHLCGY